MVNTVDDVFELSLLVRELHFPFVKVFLFTYLRAKDSNATTNLMVFQIPFEDFDLSFEV